MKSAAMDQRLELVAEAPLRLPPPRRDPELMERWRDEYVWQLFRPAKRRGAS